MDAAIVLVIAITFWTVRVILSIPLPQQVGRWNGDLYTIYYPLYSFAYRGDAFLPAWNPYQLAGTPCLGTYAGGLMYPPNMLTALIPVHRALGYLVVLHLALAGIGTLALARYLSLSRAACVLAASGFMLNRVLVGEHIRPMYLAGLSWIPIVCLLLLRLLAAPSPGRAVLLGGALALQFLTGNAQIVCYEAYTLLLVVGPALVLLRGPGDRRYVGRLAAGAVLALATALLLSAAQLLPTLEVMSEAVRGFGGLTVAQTLPQKPTWPFIRSAAASSGLLALLLPFSFLSRRTAPGLVVIAWCVIGFAGAIGVGTPLYDRFFFLLPGVRLFRVPHDILVIGALALSLLGAQGFDAIRARTPGGATAIGAAVAAGVGVALLREFASPALVLAFCGVLGALAMMPIRGVRMALAGLLVAVVLAEAFTRPGNWFMIPAVNDAAFFAEPSVAGFLRGQGKDGRVLVVKDWNRRFPIMEKVGSLWRVPVVQDYEALTPRAYQRFLGPLDRYNTDRPLFWGRFVPSPSDEHAWRRLDLLSTRYVLVAPTVGWRSSERFRPIYRGPDGSVYENAAALPRAYLVARHRVVSDPEAVLAAIGAPTFDPRREVVVDRPVGWSPGGKSKDVPTEVVMVTSSTGQLTLDVRTPEPALLVLTDLYWPGWEVTVDGDPRDIYRANYLFRAVAIEPGGHTVIFRYTSRGVRLGIATTLATALVILLGAVTATSRSRRPRSPTHSEAGFVTTLPSTMI